MAEGQIGAAWRAFVGTAVRPLRPDHIIERPTMVLTLDA